MVEQPRSVPMLSLGHLIGSPWIVLRIFLGGGKSGLVGGGNVATWEEGEVTWYSLFAHARAIPEIFCELVRLWTSYTWLLCGEITKLDIQLAVGQLCLRGDGFHCQRHKG